PANAGPQPLFQEPTFSEGVPTGSPNGFGTVHPSDKALYKELGDRLKKDVVSFDVSRDPDNALLELEKVYGEHGPEIVKLIKNAKKIVFHSIGDSGASNAGKYPNEIRVSDQLTADCHISAEADRPAFLYHLGDVVYDFGESKYYYDQFYEPFRNYPV